MDPRISFSNDFVDSQEAIKYREAPVSSDFEFSVRNYKMIPADEIFCKGMILPLKDNSSSKLRKMTLKDELLVDDDDEDDDYDDGFDPLPRAHKSSGWWKERLGIALKRSTAHHIVSNKKGDRSIGVLQGIVENKTPGFVHQGLDAKNIGIVD